MDITFNNWIIRCTVYATFYCTVSTTHSALHCNKMLHCSALHIWKIHHCTRLHSTAVNILQCTAVQIFYMMRSHSRAAALMLAYINHSFKFLSKNRNWFISKNCIYFPIFGIFLVFFCLFLFNLKFCLRKKINIENVCCNALHCT